MPHNGTISFLNYLFCYLETLFVIKQKIRRMFIRAYLVIACKLCLMSVRYLVLLFLVWKLYWNMAASTLLCSSKGIASIFRLTSTLSTLAKYQNTEGWKNRKYSIFIVKIGNKSMKVIMK